MDHRQTDGGESMTDSGITLEDIATATEEARQEVMGVRKIRTLARKRKDREDNRERYRAYWRKYDRTSRCKTKEAPDA